MKRIFLCFALLLALCFVFASCNIKKTDKNDNDSSSESTTIDSSITQGVGDASIDVNDIFSDSSESGDSSSSDASASVGDSSESDSSDGNDSSDTNSSIDYEDKSVWTDPVKVN